MSRESGYIVRYDCLPPEHPLQRDKAYQAYLEERDAQGLNLQRHPIPPGYFGLVVEVNTSSHWTARRPQIAIGSIQERTMLRVRKGHSPQEGLGGLYVAREAVFMPYESPRTAYGDEALDLAISPVGRMTWSHRAPRRSAGAHDPTRLHQHRSSANRTTRRDLCHEGEGMTFTTSGEPLAQATHREAPVWAHMLVRIIGREDFAHALALSCIGEKTLFFPEERKNELGICYELLFRPGPQK